MLEIFQQYTLNLNDPNLDFNKNKKFNANFGPYLSGSGSIEGDGNIYIPKNNQNNSKVSIVFHSKDYPLALKLKETLGFGNIYKKKRIVVLMNILLLISRDYY